MNRVATRFTQGDLNSTTVISAESIYVHGIMISNASAVNASLTTTVQNSSGSKTYFKIHSISANVDQLSDNNTFIVDVPFLADEGLRVTEGTTNITLNEDFKFTVFYSNGGG